MKKLLSRVIAASSLTFVFTFSGTFTNAHAEEPLGGGLYFADSNGGVGDYYDFTQWSNTSAKDQTNLILSYKPVDITIFLNVTNKVAKWNEILAKGDFVEASTEYTQGSISGNFKNAATGDIINAGETNEFEVIGIE